MTHKIKVGKPLSYSFVRGTSVEKVVELLTNSQKEWTATQFLDETTFHVYANPNFPRTYEFSESFRAKSVRDNILPAKYFAQTHARNDYLENIFSTMNSNSTNNFSNYHFKSFYSTFSAELKANGFSAQKVEDEFIHARRYRGVLLYFNELLAQNHVFRDTNEKQHRRFNSIRIYSENPINIECLTAIEPIGNHDKIELKYIMKKLS
jgi:hypothetical protein